MSNAVMKEIEKPLPEGWRMVKFGDIAKNISKRVDPSKTDLDIYVGLEHLDPDSLNINRHGVPSDVAGQKLLVKKGQIIFGKRRAYQRKVAVADWDCICSAHAMVLEAKPEIVSPEFFPFFMQSDVFMNRAISISEGSLSPTIKWKTLCEQKFLLPNKDYQKQFVKTFILADKNKDLISSQIDAGEILKQSLLASLLLNGVHDGNTVKTKFGRMPEHWMLASVGELTIEHKQGFYTTQDYTQEGCYFIRISDLRNPKVIFKDMPRVMIEESTINQYRVQRGDFLFARSGTIGRYGIYDSDNDAVFASYLIRFRFDETKLLTRYFGYFYESIHCARQLRGIAQQGSNVNINAENIKSLKIPLPPIEEQNYILQKLLELDAILDELHLKRECLRMLSKSITLSMLNGA